MNQVGTYLLSLGLPGIVIIALAYALHKLFILYHETQEKRIEENKDCITAINEMRSSIEGMKMTMETLSRTQAGMMHN